MIIVLINWRILPGREDEFLSHWKTELTIDNAPELLGEFISHVKDEEWCGYITWQLEPGTNEEVANFGTQEFCSFVNVGFWQRIENFLEAVKDYMDREPYDFEAAPRRRAIVEPKAWRIGGGQFPAESSAGVVP